MITARDGAVSYFYKLARIVINCIVILSKLQRKAAMLEAPGQEGRKSIDKNLSSGSKTQFKKRIGSTLLAARSKASLLQSHSFSGGFLRQELPLAP
jgi:hypothetical protein